MVRYAGFGGLFNEVWKMSFQGKKIQILVFYLPLYIQPLIVVIQSCQKEDGSKADE